MNELEGVILWCVHIDYNKSSLGERIKNTHGGGSKGHLDLVIIEPKCLLPNMAHTMRHLLHVLGSSSYC